MHACATRATGAIGVGIRPKVGRNAVKKQVTRAVAQEKKGSTMVEFSPLVNSTPVRLAALAAVCAYAWRPEAGIVQTQAGSMVHLTAFSVWLGTVVWTTFVAGLTMFKNLPRQTFGKLQSKLFPKYFGLSAGMLVIMLATMVGSAGGTWPKAANTLAFSLACTMLNIVLLEPKATEIMFEKYEVENNEGMGKEEKESRLKMMGKKFGKWHGMSSLSNLCALCGAVAHAWYLAAKLTVA